MHFPFFSGQFSWWRDFGNALDGAHYQQEWEDCCLLTTGLEL